VCQLRRIHPGWGRRGLAGSWSELASCPAVAGDDLADPGPQRADRSPAAPAPPRLSALGAPGADVAVADGHHGWGLAGRRRRVQAGHRDRRPLPLLRGGPPGAPGDRPGGVPGTGGRLAGLGAAHRGPDRQRSAVHRQVRQAAPDRGAVRADPARQRHHPPPHQGPLADHHREGGAVPPDPAAGAARASAAVRQPGAGAEGGRCLGGGLQPPAAPSGAGDGGPSIAVPSPPGRPGRA